MSENKNPKFPTIDRPRWEPNDNINHIQGLIDFIKDEYGNYYTPYRVATTGSENGLRLTKVTLAHELYVEAFSTIFLQDEMGQDYKYSHLGELLLDRMNGHLKELELEGRKIFTIQDLIANGTEVSFWDITHYKTQKKNK